MSFESYRIIFVTGNEVEAAVSKEVTAWKSDDYKCQPAGSQVKFQTVCAAFSSIAA